MLLTERHLITLKHKHFKEIDELSFKSKNLYNQANYRIRQAFTNKKDSKYINYNELQKELQSQLPKNQFNSNKINKITNKRNNKIDNYLHKVSKFVINYCLTNDVDKIIIGKNTNWKQEINIGKRNNQNFVNIPHAKLIQQIEYKAKLEGIEVITITENYTSKTSFIDNETICKQYEYCGKRIKRGLFKSKEGYLINADINGAFNILRKATPNFNVNNIKNGAEGTVVSPLKVTL